MLLRRSCLGRLPVLAVSLGLAFGVTAAAAQGSSLSKLLKPDPAPAEKAAAPTTAEADRSLEERAAQAERDIAAERSGLRPVPAGATPSQIAEIGWLLQRLGALLQSQVDVSREIASARAAREEAERSSAAAVADKDTGPHTVSELDEQYERLDAERTRLNSFESVATLNREELNRLEAIYKERQAEERLAFDAAARGAPAELEVAQLRTRRIREAMALLQLQGQLNEELAQASRLRLAQLERRVAVISASYRFTPEELDRVERALQARVTALDRRLEETSAARSAATAERDRARRAIESLPAPTKVEDVRRRAEAEARLHAASTTLDALRAQQSALTSQRSLAPLGVELWRHRYTAINSKDPQERNAAIEAIKTSFDRVRSLQSYASDLGILIDTALQEQQRRVDMLDAQAPGRRYEEAALASIRRAVEGVGELQVTALKVRAAATHWSREFATMADQRTAEEKLAEAWADTKKVARDVWNFELFAVEDTVDIAGKPTTVSRGVTIGKSIGALLIFVVGFTLASGLARRAQHVMVTRFAVAESQARVLRRWVMMLAAFVLLILTLNLARIPLTVFAFLGGALAIGVGFGTQTLLKNLISGIIVLFERKVRVGDIVDVEGVQGIVTAVDIRSTTVRQFDGIETMVPNSMLLENKVTNWTGETPTMRRVVKVGVAYGSPTRQVADILQKSAEDHGLIMKDPPPLVIFEDFGDNALVFALYFWVDVSKHSGMQVQSDVRFMLEKRLAEAGIAISYPQRDLHLDTARPLQIEVVSGPLPAAAQPPASAAPPAASA
jgi:small-conductance mechanosensitive channel